MSIGIGDPIPDATLLRPDGGEVRLREVAAGRPLVVAFYPKDFSPVCSIEARRFRDAYERFRALGAEVVGISSDPPESHCRFSEKNDIPFDLLTDPDGAARAAFGVPRTLGIIPGRVTYIADRERIVRHVFQAQFAAQKHVDEALAALERLL